MTDAPMNGDLVFPLGSAIWERIELLLYARASPLLYFLAFFARVAGEDACTTFFENSVLPDQRGISHMQDTDDSSETKISTYSGSGISLRP